MSEKPILFSGPMVRAILEGRKTQTRRVVKGELSGIDPQTGKPFACGDSIIHCPYGVVGSRLWVRESFVIESSLDYPMSKSNAPKDGRQQRYWDDPAFGTRWEIPWFQATDGEPHIVSEDADDDRTRWKPSIHMPRWASRILLEVTDVRVQRLQEISEEDAASEGWTCGQWVKARKASEWFRELWDSINAKRGFGWDVNPWVWAITFRRVNP